MTADELKNYLESYQSDRKGLEICIDALTRYRRRLEHFKNDFQATPYIQDVEKRIQAERDALASREAILKSWAELIPNATYRAMFLDHYCNNKTWQQIEKEYNYSRSHVFHIFNQCCKHISASAVCDLNSNSCGKTKAATT